MLGHFRLLLTVLAAFVTLAYSLPAGVPSTNTLRISNAGTEGIIPNSYIVVYNTSFATEDIDSYESSIKAHIAKRNIHARDINGKRGGLSTTVTTMSMGGAWRCMTLEADDDTINAISDSPQVAYVEANAKVTTNVLVEQRNSTPGLSRISHAEVGATNYVFDDSAGEGVTVYVVDTGVKASHSEFGGRAEVAFNAVNDGIDDDGNGHGSHVSGTIGGTTFGVAKSATIKAIKVLGSDGSGSNADVINGLDFVSTDAVGKRAVVNMSLGGAKSNAVNAAVNALSAQNIIPVVAAGNENQDTANTSPGSATGVITVGAIDDVDAKASFSNFGPDVDIFAPGVDVLSVGIQSNTDTAILSGTSMASPHVAGMVAVLMSQDSSIRTVNQVKAKLAEFAGVTGASVTGLSAANAGTTDAIAYNGSGQ